MALNTNGPVRKMEPPMGLLCTARNNVDSFQFFCMVPMQILFGENGQSGKNDFVTIWKEITVTNERHFPLGNPTKLNLGIICLSVLLNVKNKNKVVSGRLHANIAI